ncbi:MAG: glycosyltransferase family 2 protein [Candidatus Komeilibacteria bacterium CG_4_10_14_0_2_um_filter_37_10]|uniref:Glycosyltransferase family 2 protein n=1 Tax=Candidatus Komeilibacteria bacterium CG_4_10_14_0_2_um_filter_37_10 TaxID=1974470 RepID=A0A2M7VGQ0_9BACT|nr:MAG: glycosyltransferase family 2 protein [Candidatus Komeilibacteria bacterium CG_4_10_14_0_2_um_filter_37_10]PJA94204.1 MAG: glycosyltransferase family 2 protein [Candidatus Komeilibacteria bacterium CG_4_9_14_3_um_filter_37_5]
MAISPAKIFIVIPAYNEQDNISIVIQSLLKYEYQVIVVNDGSTDQTSWQVQQFPPVILLEHLVNLGMGAALATGTKYALSQGAQIIVHFDADRQMRVADIAQMILPIVQQEVDVTIGNRLANSQIPVLKKYFIFPIARILNNLMTGLYLVDVHNGFRALNAKAAQKINIEQQGMAHATEIVQKIKKFNLKYREVPVTIDYHVFGQGIGGGLKILHDLFLKKIV